MGTQSSSTKLAKKSGEEIEKRNRSYTRKAESAEKRSWLTCFDPVNIPGASTGGDECQAARATRLEEEVGKKSTRHRRNSTAYAAERNSIWTGYQWKQSCDLHTSQTAPLDHRRPWIHARSLPATQIRTEKPGLVDFLADSACPEITSPKIPL